MQFDHNNTNCVPFSSEVVMEGFLDCCFTNVIPDLVRVGLGLKQRLANMQTEFPKFLMWSVKISFDKTIPDNELWIENTVSNNPRHSLRLQLT